MLDSLHLAGNLTDVLMQIFLNTCYSNFNIQSSDYFLSLTMAKPMQRHRYEQENPRSLHICQIQLRHNFFIFCKIVGLSLMI